MWRLNASRILFTASSRLNAMGVQHVVGLNDRSGHRSVPTQSRSKYFISLFGLRGAGVAQSV
jgi:hypothetical protein